MTHGGRTLRLPTLLLGLCVLGAVGCDDLGDTPAPSAGGEQGHAGDAGMQRPEPARFGRSLGTVSPEAQAQMDAGTTTPGAGSLFSAFSRRSDDLPGIGATAAKFTDPIVIRAGMAIDNDGQIRDAGQAERIRRQRDPHHQSETSLRYRDGSSLDPTSVPYIVVPVRQKALLGDLAVVSYRGRSIAAVVGDCGPRYGEASVALADSLGVDSHGVTGGIASGVTYVIYPRSGQGRPADADHLKQLLAASERPLLADASSRLPGLMVAQR